jgi:hypothetical protein
LVDTGKLKPHPAWKPGNCAEPNALNNLAHGKPHDFNETVIYTFERKSVRIPDSSETEWRIASKEPCRYCRTLPEILGVEIPQFERIKRGDGIDTYEP